MKQKKGKQVYWFYDKKLDLPGTIAEKLILKKTNAVEKAMQSYLYILDQRYKVDSLIPYFIAVSVIVRYLSDWPIHNILDTAYGRA